MSARTAPVGSRPERIGDIGAHRISAHRSSPGRAHVRTYQRPPAPYRRVPARLAIPTIYSRAQLNHTCEQAHVRGGVSRHVRPVPHHRQAPDGSAACPTGPGCTARPASAHPTLLADSPLHNGAWRDGGGGRRLCAPTRGTRRQCARATSLRAAARQ